MTTVAFGERSSCFAAFVKARLANPHLEIELVDFDELNLEVPAYRHTNPNGMPGGWVALNTTSVHPECQIDSGALVYENASIGKNVRLMDGSVVKGEAKVSGALILGERVTFEGFATCRIKPQVRHPAYIGHHPFNFPKMIIENGEFTDSDTPRLSEIKCAKHPVIKRFREGVYIVTIVSTDSMVIVSKNNRGYGLIADFHDDMKGHASPTGKESLSWNPNRFQTAVIPKRVIEKFPELLDQEVRRLLETDQLKRIVNPGPSWAQGWGRWGESTALTAEL